MLGKNKPTSAGNEGKRRVQLMSSNSTEKMSCFYIVEDTDWRNLSVDIYRGIKSEPSTVLYLGCRTEEGDSTGFETSNGS